MRHCLAAALALSLLPGCGTFLGTVLGDEVDDRRTRALAPAQTLALAPTTTVEVTLRDGSRFTVPARVLQHASDTLHLRPGTWVLRRDVVHLRRPPRHPRRALVYGLGGFVLDVLSVSWSCPLGVLCWVVN